jgi:hypothetical protein
MAPLLLTTTLAACSASLDEQDLLSGKVHTMTRQVDRSQVRKSQSRRAFLASATAGAAIGSGAISGFPTIWAQNVKDIVLRHAGPPVSAIPRIAEQATKDLGFTVQMQTTENADLLNRLL